MTIQNRYEFVYFFDVTNGNPNGDPDAGNMPRLDPESSKGLVTDVSLKRKIRNYIQLSEENSPGYDIYVQEKSVLNQQNQKAYDALEIKSEPKKLPKDQAKAKEVTDWMCANFFDVRAFGAVMTTEVNSGQVRGPLQLAFAKSIDPIIPLEISITRMAVTNEKDLEKERTMGRKHIVPYGLYRVHGFVSAKLAEKTGFSEDDLEKVWKALEMMFEHDHSAARGEMVGRSLIVFKHENALGNAPAHKLFERVTVERVNGEEGTPAAAFSDYKISFNADGLESLGVEAKQYF
ncbi:type I-C CRISPR-associated protein Cas7/Csd2 [Pseudoalteromonas sp. L23]|uniref:type I-C CRISPR-associated protein Cas7/Csd2 n=1 Tax=unclassified Pseudoalteromonas TaxID=194690 RepID=UPI001EF09DDF|nr:MULTISPECIES: type I-C CRISPR-associated protein Cas7/Csd2 [unclassified Pseudoalteromonas]MCF7515464.1 type I-C CRISPR-associated protein Cas7/Csd2 [Pseudoalteromonas sp. L7]MCF7527357.1 type I-C CRISPR-associated protein Cas7/Csd2 [Pseudoalteromonas sp. L23]MCX2767727.1 type I-C CRISPR-associated protein Cas7/Csd2 [Pseudoalteromonas sp. B530]